MGSTKDFDLNQFLEPLSDSVISVLETMTQIKLKREGHELKACSELGSKLRDVSGVISIGEETLSGTLALSFDETLIKKMYSNILGGVEVTAIDSDVCDAVMEFTNVIFGNAKRDINKLGFDIQPALPNVIVGHAHSVHHNQKAQCLCVKFSSEHGQLCVQCSVLLS